MFIGLGESDDIHPRDERLAAVTLVKHQRQTMPSSGPVYNSCKVKGGAVRVTFGRDGGALVTRPLPDAYVTTGRTTSRAGGPRPPRDATRWEKRPR